MKHLKSFEKVLINPTVGCYVIYNETFLQYPELSNFLSNNIGKIIKKYYNGEFAVKYDDVPQNIEKHFYTIYGQNMVKIYKRENIEHFSTNKEDLEAILNSKKYNL